MELCNQRNPDDLREVCKRKKYHKGFHSNETRDRGK